MIRLVTANDSRFKTMLFGPGLNVVLAQRAPQSSDLQTRNGSGKSSLLRVIHFLLGANAGYPFKSPELNGWIFAMAVDVGGQSIVTARATSETGRVHFVSAEDGYRATNLNGWKSYLARQWFALGDETETYKPSLRSLLSYLVREAHDGGMSDFYRNSSKQQSWDSQVAISFLLGLDWRIPSKIEAVRDEEKLVDNVTKAARSGQLGDAIGSAAELRTELAVARDEARATRTRLENFKVLESYRDLQEEADSLTRELRDIRDADATDRDLILDLEAAQREEAPPGAADIEDLWREANVVLPDAVRERYEAVRQFHESVISNRVNYLTREAEAARRRISDRERERDRLSERRREVLSTLESGGALEQFAGMQVELGRQQGLVAAIEERLALAEQIESGKAKADQHRQELFLQLQEDYHDREAALSRAIALFERYSRRLYDDRRGSLVIEPSKTGPKFKVNILGQGSVGIDSMQTLCFDFVLMTLLAEQKRGPGFLVHDSHVFDGVDERQVANALALGAELAEGLDFQYIVTLNEDSVPSEFPGGFDFWSAVNPVRLTDATDDGGLFGLRLAAPAPGGGALS